MNDEHIDINAALELSHNLVDAARTAMQAAHKLRELAEALRQATHGGWFPASVPPPACAYVLALDLGAKAWPIARCVTRQDQSGQWYDQRGVRTNAPDYWCHLPKAVDRAIGEPS